MLEMELTLKVPIRIVAKDARSKICGFAGHSGLQDDDTGKMVIEFWPGSDNLRAYLGDDIIENGNRLTIYADIGDQYMPCDIAQQILQLVKDKETEINEMIAAADADERLALLAEIEEISS